MFNYVQIVYVCKSAYPHRKKVRNYAFFLTHFYYIRNIDNIKYNFTVFRTY